MIFVTGIVPNLFSTGLISPILKKGKPTDCCSSFRPITVSLVLCKVFELLVVDEIFSRCYTPENQFGFKKGVGREYAHHLIANLLLHASENDEVPFFCRAGRF